MPDTVKAKSYLFALTIDPARKDFSGHAEIDAVLTEPARHIFQHGIDLRVSGVQVRSKAGTLTATYERDAALLDVWRWPRR